MSPGFTKPLIEAVQGLCKPSPGNVQRSAAWKTLPERVRQHAQKLRQALSGALQLRQTGKWSNADIEGVGLRDYKAVFGHEITPRTFWRLVERTAVRAGNSADFSCAELYLPGIARPRPARPAYERTADALPDLAQAITSVQNPCRPTLTETQLVWSAACQEWQRISGVGATATNATRIVLRALAESGIELARSRSALKKTFQNKRARWIENGGTPETLRDTRPLASGWHRELPISEQDRHRLIAGTLTGPLSKSWRDALRAGALSSDATSAYIANPANKSYVPRRVREVVAPDARALDDLHHGPRQAALKGAYITRDWSAVAPGDWYSADDVTLPLYYWQEDEQGRPQTMRGQCLLMSDCRTGRALAFALHSERNYTAKTIRGLILKTHDTYGLPRRGFYFENGTWKKARLLKGAADEVPCEETELGLREWVEFKHAKPGNPRAKTIERIIGLIQDCMEDQPGYCGRNEQIEKFERLQKQLLDARAGRVHPREFLLHRDEWSKRLADICDAYNHEQQQGRMLRGLSPRETWEALFDHASPLVRLGEETRYILANHRRPLKVGKNGICIQVGKERMWFRNETTGRLIGRTVQAYFNPEDLRSIYIKLSDSDTVAAVIPAAPVTPAMSATPEQMRTAYESVEAHNRPMRTLYQEIAPHFPDNRPSPFRLVVADAASIELGRDIAADQAAINEQQEQAHSMRRKIARYQRIHSIKPHGAVSDARRLAAYELLEEANKHDNTQARPRE